MAICLIWRVDWPVGVLGGLIAAALVYWIWRALEPRVEVGPQWLWSLVSSAMFAGVAWLWLATLPEPLLGWVYLLIAFMHFDRGVWDYLHRHQRVEAAPAE